MNYCLTMDGLVRFIDMIYVPDSSELKNVILREFHVKPYLGHLCYQKIMTTVNKIYYWLNLEKDVVDFVARGFNLLHVKVECKHLGGLIQRITTPKFSMKFITSLSTTMKQK